VVTSAERLLEGWHGARRQRRAGRDPGVSHVERLLARLPGHGGLVTVLDGHPATLSWLAGVGRHKTQSLGVESFGQSADLVDIYRAAGIDAEAIVDAAARLCLTI
jgi:pyruvate dehydrogenase E1 component